MGLSVSTQRRFDQFLDERGLRKKFAGIRNLLAKNGASREASYNEAFEQTLTPFINWWKSKFPDEAAAFETEWEEHKAGPVKAGRGGRRARTVPSMVDVSVHGAEDVDWKSKNVTATPLANTEWVFNNLGVTSPDPNSCPSSGAWFQLLWLRENPDQIPDFMVSVYARTMPSRKELDNASKFEDDGRKGYEVIHALMADPAPAPDPVQTAVGDNG